MSLFLGEQRASPGYAFMLARAMTNSRANTLGRRHQMFLSSDALSGGREGRYRHRAPHMSLLRARHEK